MILTTCPFCSNPIGQARLVGRRHDCSGLGGAEVIMWQDAEPWVVLDGPRPLNEQPEPCFHKVVESVTKLPNEGGT